MQQMVSRANVPRTMASATQLTAPEKRELGWESRWEQGKLESQQFEARWEKMMQQLRNMIFPKPIREVTVVDKESSFASPVEEVDLHLASHDGGLDVHQTMAMADLDSGSRESQMRERELRMNCSTDHDPLEIVVTQLQKTEKMELSMPLPHKDLDLSKIVDDGSVEQLSGVVKKESMMLGRKDAIGNSEEFGNYSSFSLQFCLDAKASGGKIDHGQVMNGMELKQNQPKGTECLSHARQNAPMRELSVVLPISACYSLSLSWLLNWFPRPTVKLKFMAQHDEEMDNEGNVQWVLAKAEKDRIYVVVLEVLGRLCDGEYDAYALSNLQELTMTGVLWCDCDTQRSFMKMEDLENDRYEMKLGATMDSVDSLASYMNTLRDLGDNSRKFAELKIAVGNSARVSKVIEDADFSEEYQPDLLERNTIGVLELSKFLDNGLVKQHSSGRYEEIDMDLKVSTFELAGTVMNLTSVSKCNGFANFLKECYNEVDYDYLVINPTEDFSLESRDYPEWNQRSFILLPIREDALMKEVIIVLPTSTCYYLALKWLLVWDTKPNMKMKCIRVAMPNMFSNIALSRSIFTASVRELEVAVELLVYEEGLDSHHLHSTSRILARDSSSYASSNNHRSLKRLLVRFPKPMVKIKLRALVVEGHGNSTYADNISLRRIRPKRANFN
ncbi:hypothetical protein SASPL_108810 [Salvia splendens]|uniref:Uncharacterized protein n=1 Tax=Salvia splendens TaxID=180675 RepID=A0A8X9A6J0_SALSN|nr:hypothetical protein SASPL_108810 [Salvia splendens]